MSKIVLLALLLTGPSMAYSYMDISAGTQGMCVISLKGALSCWGNDNFSNQVSPKTDKKFKQVAVGTNHVCAITEAGKIDCWGKNSFGQSKPSMEIKSMNFKQVVAGKFHSCALTENNQVLCWGKQISPSETEQYREISAGDSYTCGILDDGRIKCWGESEVDIPIILQDRKFSSLSVGKNTICGITPSKVICWGIKFGHIRWASKQNQLAEKIAVGKDHACAIDRTGVIRCWGDNYFGQTSVPSSMAKACLISAAMDYTCVITNNGLACWGIGDNNQTPYKPAALKDLACVATPPNANDPNTEMAQIKETTNLLLSSNGKDYELNCLAQKRDSVLKKLGYPKGLEGVSKIEQLSNYRRWTLEQTLACYDPNQGEIYVTTEPVSGSNEKQRYYWLKPDSSEKLYLIGCQGLLDVLGFKHTELTEENTIDPRDYLKESINCRAGLPPGLFRDRLKGDGFGPAMVGLPNANFAISRYEITVEEYKSFADATNRQTPVCICGQEENNEEQGDYPVTNVFWEDATAYAAWLSKKTGKKYRLPTETEWEYAARAGKRTKYGWGNQLDSSKANYRSDNESWIQKKSMPVGSFPPNAFGVYDMVGNVLEWTCSKYEQGTETKCFEDGKSSQVVLRGGSFIQNDVRIARRYQLLCGVCSDANIGFRVVRVIQ